MDQEAPFQSIELDNISHDSAPSLDSGRPPHGAELDATQTEPNHVVGSNQSVTATSVVEDETGDRGMLRHCSSQRMSVVFGLLALVIAIYSYYGQYQLSWKSWALGLWKDCRDRNDIATSDTCLRYQNTTYDQIVTRDLKSPSKSTLTPSHRELGLSTLIRELLESKKLLVVRVVAPIFACFVLIGWFCAIGAVIFHVLIFVSDMTSGHAFPYRAYVAVYVFINTSIATATSSYWGMRVICGALSILNLFRHFTLVKAALRICVEARHAPSTKGKWERQSISGLLCTPYIHTLSTGLILFNSCAITASSLPNGLSQNINSLFIASCVSLFTFLALLSITQNLILRTEDRLSTDFEAQSSVVIEVSHKNMLLSRVEAVPGQLRNRWAPSSASKKITRDTRKF